MTIDYAIAAILAALITLYLVYALVRPEKF
jgi:K+-transporting ATPase KdpF subunit